MSRNTNAMKQEGFEIAQDPLPRRPYFLRQDRHTFADGKCHLEFQGGGALEIFNLSIFGVAVEVEAETAPALAALLGDEGRGEARLLYAGREVQKLRLRKVREEEVPSLRLGAGMAFLWAFESLGEPIAVGKLHTLAAVRGLLQNQETYAARVARLPWVYRQKVFEIRDWLQQLQAAVAELEKNLPVESAELAFEYRKALIHQLSEFLSQVLPPLYQALPPLLKGLSAEELQLAAEFVREQVSPSLRGVPAIARVLSKPRGAAGEARMIQHFHQGDFAGRTLFDQILQKYFLAEPAVEAVRNRGRYLAEKISQVFATHPPGQELNILSLANGTAVELEYFLQNGKKFYGGKATFTCADLAEESLKSAQRQIALVERQVKSGFQYDFQPLTLSQLLVEGLPEGAYDLIYSAGLFDYLTEPVARMTAQRMFLSLKPGGRMIIGNFSTDNPSASLMELSLDWNLIHRTQADLERLYQNLGRRFYVEAEPLGVNLFAVIEK